MPPSLFVCNTDSPGEQIQRAFPDARVVKSLNNPALVPGPHNVFLSGNDTAVRERVRALQTPSFNYHLAVGAKA